MSTTITEKINNLTSEQAQRALLILYDLMPSNMWEDQKKPSTVRIETLADKIQDAIPEDIRPLLDIIRTGGEDGHKGELTKILLRTFSADEAVSPLLAQAITKATEPHMAPIPLYIGAFMIVMAAFSSEIKGKGWSFKGRAPELVEKLADFVKALPTKLLEGLYE